MSSKVPISYDRSKRFVSSCVSCSSNDSSTINVTVNARLALHITLSPKALLSYIGEVIGSLDSPDSVLFRVLLYALKLALLFGIGGADV